MSTSELPHTAGLRGPSYRNVGVLEDKSDRRRARKTREIRKECRTAAWREKGRGVSTIAATPRHSATAGRQATRTESPLRGKMRARPRATDPTAIPAQMPSVHAIPQVSWPRQASKMRAAKAAARRVVRATSETEP